MYEYQSSYKGTTYKNGYLNNGLYWWTLTPGDYMRTVRYDGDDGQSEALFSEGVRPSINLQSSVKIVSGDGTVDNPYRLAGDNDTDLKGVKLNTRYSGEYISFGTGKNNLYRIVSHETSGLTKIVSAEPLKKSGKFITKQFSDSNVSDFEDSTIKEFLNNDYLTEYVGDNYINMIEDNTSWYVGTVNLGKNYKLAKYIDTSMTRYAKSTKAKVSLLRFGELMSGQFERYAVKGGSTSKGLTTDYWLLTGDDYYSDFGLRYVMEDGTDYSESRNYEFGVKPSMNLKEKVIITSGDGTKNNPFMIELPS